MQRVEYSSSQPLARRPAWRLIWCGWKVIDLAWVEGTWEADDKNVSRGRITRMSLGKSRRLMPVLLAGLVLGVGGGYAWTFTPSYSLYCLKHALETHDYE